MANRRGQYKRTFCGARDPYQAFRSKEKSVVVVVIVFCRFRHFDSICHLDSGVGRC